MDDTLSDPKVEVLGYTHTALLGLVEVGIGAALLIIAAFGVRALATFFGTVLAIASFVAAVEATRLEARLGLDSGLAWVAFAAGLVVVISSLLIPRVTSRTAVYDVS